MCACPPQPWRAHTHQRCAAFIRLLTGVRPAPAAGPRRSRLWALLTGAASSAACTEVSTQHVDHGAAEGHRGPASCMMIEVLRQGSAHMVLPQAQALQAGPSATTKKLRQAASGPWSSWSRQSRAPRPAASPRPVQTRGHAQVLNGHVLQLWASQQVRLVWDASTLDPCWAACCMMQQQRAHAGRQAAPQALALRTGAAGSALECKLLHCSAA